MLGFDDAPEKPTNLSLNSKVFEMAREPGMNVSHTVDTLLAEEMMRKRALRRPVEYIASQHLPILDALDTLFGAH